MNKFAWVGCGLLIACVVVGCAKSDDDYAKEQIAIMDEMTAELEKVKDKDTATAAKPKLEALAKRAKENAKVMDAWPKEKKEQMTKKYEDKLKASMERFMKAGLAAQTSGGGDVLKSIDVK